MPIRNRTVSASRPGLFATTMTATTTGPKPAAVNAEAAARCPARQASSLRNVDGRRIPAKRFLGNRPVAAMRPSPTTTTPPNPNRIAFNTSARLRQFARARTIGPERSYGLGAYRPQIPAFGKLSWSKSRGRPPKPPPRLSSLGLGAGPPRSATHPRRCPFLNARARAKMHRPAGNGRRSGVPGGQGNNLEIRGASRRRRLGSR